MWGTPSPAREEQGGYVRRRGSDHPVWSRLRIVRTASHAAACRRVGQPPKLRPTERTRATFVDLAVVPAHVPVQSQMTRRHTQLVVGIIGVAIVIETRIPGAKINADGIGERPTRAGVDIVCSPGFEVEIRRPVEPGVNRHRSIAASRARMEFDEVPDRRRHRSRRDRCRQ